jgi:hypothetical protein
MRSFEKRTSLFTGRGTLAERSGPSQQSPQGAVPVAKMLLNGPIDRKVAVFRLELRLSKLLLELNPLFVCEV